MLLCLTEVLQILDIPIPPSALSALDALSLQIIPLRCAPCAPSAVLGHRTTAAAHRSKRLLSTVEVAAMRRQKIDAIYTKYKEFKQSMHILPFSTCTFASQAKEK